MRGLRREKDTCICAAAPLSVLVQRAGHGDEHAFARLYGVLAPLLLAWAQAACLDARSREDAVCAAMVRLWRHAPGYDPHRERVDHWIISKVAPLLTGPAEALGGALLSQLAAEPADDICRLACECRAAMS